MLLLVVVGGTTLYSSITKAPVTALLSNLFGSQVWAQESDLATPSNTLNSQTMSLLEATLAPEPNRKKSGESITTVGGVALLPEAGPSGTLLDVDGANATDQISIYTVRNGDSLSSIAKMFDVSKNTILWANDIKGGQVKPGDRLVILPVDGIRHNVKKGDTVASIAKKYKVSATEIAQFNDIAITDTLDIGDTVIVPEGKFETPGTSAGGTKAAPGKNFDSYFIRPIVGGKKTQGIHGHNGVDLASAFGTPIMAAASGTVIVSKTGGYNGGYGNFIVINHPNGTQTLYGHLSATLVSVGQKVDQGEVIGKMGSTGNSTGNHVHFEIHGARNPF